MKMEELVGIQKAETVTNQRKSMKKSRAQPQHKSKARKKLYDVSEEESNITEYEEVEVLDCIEVEMCVVWDHPGLGNQSIIGHLIDIVGS